MYLWGLQVRRERTDRHAPSTKEGPSMIRKKKKKGASTVVDRKEEILSDERKKTPLDEIKKWVHPYGKRGGPTPPLLEPTPDQTSRLHMSTTNGATRYDEFAGGVGTTHQKVENPDSA
jgi:hypothetical protein